MAEHDRPRQKTIATDGASTSVKPGSIQILRQISIHNSISSVETQRFLHNSHRLRNHGGLLPFLTHWFVPGFLDPPKFLKEQDKMAAAGGQFFNQFRMVQGYDFNGIAALSNVPTIMYSFIIGFCSIGSKFDDFGLESDI
jgi:hypothetical protein